MLVIDCFFSYVCYFINVNQCVQGPVERMGNPCSVVTNMLDCNIIVNEFELQSCYYVHFWTIMLAKSMNTFILSSYELNSTTTALL